jgi:hypothetical protein
MMVKTSCLRDCLITGSFVIKTVIKIRDLSRWDEYNASASTDRRDEYNASASPESHDIS